jgi:hypothetical protein
MLMLTLFHWAVLNMFLEPEEFGGILSLSEKSALQSTIRVGTYFLLFVYRCYNEDFFSVFNFLVS